MKQLIAVTACLLTCGTTFAQKTAANTKKAVNHKTAIAGVILNMRKQPVRDVQAFIYRKDSIMASAYTDSAGYYETNSTFAGVYNLKLVYPSEQVVIVTGVPLKATKLTMVDLKMNAPERDTTISYAALVPPPVKKENPKKR